MEKVVSYVWVPRESFWKKVKGVGEAQSSIAWVLTPAKHFTLKSARGW